MVSLSIPSFCSLYHACGLQLRGMHAGTSIVSERGLRVLCNLQHGLHCKLICALSIPRAVLTNHAEAELLRLQKGSEVIPRYGDESSHILNSACLTWKPDA
jgi:hypothetical protein